MKAPSENHDKLMEELRSEFISHFGDSSKTIFALSPASFVLLGDHTQYNDGLMVSTVSNSYLGIAVRKEKEEGVNLIFNGMEFHRKKLLDIILDAEDNMSQSLSSLLKWIERNDLLPSGFSCLILNWSSKVFGLGNSAAVTVGLLSALNEAFGLQLNQKEIVDISIESDRENFGDLVNPSLYYSSIGQHPNSLMYFDTRSLHRNYFDFDEDYSFVICNTNKLKENYREICKERIEECQIGTKGLRLYIWGIKNLRDVEEVFLENHVNMIPRRLYVRCLYNVKSRKIVDESYHNLKNNNTVEFAKRLKEMQTALSNDYEICDDVCKSLIETAENTGLVEASKMLSCSYFVATINLLRKGNLKFFKERFKKKYKEESGNEIEINEIILNGGLKIYKEKDFIDIKT